MQFINVPIEDRRGTMQELAVNLAQQKHPTNKIVKKIENRVENQRFVWVIDLQKNENHIPFVRI